MKRNILTWAFSGMVLLGSFSCSDFLDNAPDGELTLEMVFNDRVKTEDWLAGIYNAIPDPYYPMMRNYDAYADDFSPSEGWEAFGWDCISKIKGNWNSNTTWNGDYWSNLPQRIRAAYIFINNVKVLPLDTKMNEEEVKYMKAEARFLIAYYYYLMVNTYGAIPFQTWLSDINESSETMMIGQTPYDDVIDWLDKELYAVAQILPAQYTEMQKYGRATSIMALAVRARMLLFAASDLVNGNPAYKGYVNDKGQEIFNATPMPSKWDRATKASKDLLDAAHAAGHKLYYEYNDDGTIDPFMSYCNMSFTEFQHGNKEILFPRPEVGYQEYDAYSLPRGSNGQGGLGVTQSLVDAFFMSNGQPAILGYDADRKPIINTESGYSESGFSRADDVRKTKWIEGDRTASKGNDKNIIVKKGVYNMYYNREPRFYVSVMFNEAWFRTGERNVNFFYGQQDGIPLQGSLWDAPQNGYLLRKRVHPDSDVRSSRYYPSRPGILYRLGEAYLNYAEALNESDPSQTTEILKYVNLIRERAGIPGYGSEPGQIPAPSGQEEMRKAIRRERRVELNCEFAVRFDDIRRWKEMDLLRGEFYGMNAKGTEKSFDPSNPNAYYVRKPYITRGFSDKNYWFPIFQDQLDKNPNLRQLPGWQ